MTIPWIIWAEFGEGAYEYLGSATGQTFEEACQDRAKNDVGFAASFDAQKMTFGGAPLRPEADTALARPVEHLDKAS